MAKKEKINKEQEELKQRRQYNIDHNLPSEELENIRKNLWLHNILYKIMSFLTQLVDLKKILKDINLILMVDQLFLLSIMLECKI